MRPEDIESLAAPGAPALHGDLLIVGVSRPDLGSDAYRGGLVRVPLDGSPAREFTRGFRDLSPAVSPDGAEVAFLRVAEKGGSPQLHVIPVDGGEAVRLTDLPLGAGAPAWSPDSKTLAFTARVPEPGRYDDAPDARAEGPRRITTLDFRLDDVGFLVDRPTQLFTVDAAGGAEPRALTTGSAEPADPAWTPDGTHLVFAAKRDWGVADTQCTDLYAVSAEGGDPVLVARSAAEAQLPVVTRDDIVVYLGEEHTDGVQVANNTGLWAVPLRLDGTQAQPRRLTDRETVDCENSAGAPQVTADGVLVAVRNRGAIELRRVDPGADAAPLAELELVAGGKAVVKSFAADGDRVACSVSTWDTPGEVVLVEAGGARVLTDFGADFRATGPREPVEVNGTSADGYPVHGWVVLPEGEGPHPVVLSVHGGPFMYYGWGVFDEAQVYAAAGYAVVLPNPRGSAGYGESHGRAILGALGTVDADDVLAVLDAALERPDLDSTRVGVMGGSYGGWMTGWLAAHHGHRFTAAWSERAVNAWDSFLGTSDIGWWFAEAYCGTDPQALLHMSPLTHADKISVPFAVVHSEHDWRCPVEQAQRMYVALKRNGTETELVLFPSEGHELTRSGKPSRRKARFDLVLDWWARHLPVK